MNAIDALMAQQYAAVQRRFPVEDVLAGRMREEDFRRGLSAALKEAMGAMPQRAPLAAELAFTRALDGYTLDKYYLAAEAGYRFPMYALTPAGAPKGNRAVLALHGHGYGVRDIVGLMPDETPRVGDPRYHKDFAVALCRAGFTVLAPELLGFGELRYDEQANRSPGESSCNRIGCNMLLLGRTLLGARYLQCQAALDFAQAQGMAGGGRMGVMGISGGGMMATYVSALEPRVKAAVVSGYACTFEGCIYAMHHCLCNFLPGMLKAGEETDYLSLIAPRPMLWEAASQDAIFPRPFVQKAEAVLRQVYAMHRAEDCFEVDYFEGGHEISGARAYAFLQEHV